MILTAAIALAAVAASQAGAAAPAPEMLETPRSDDQIASLGGGTLLLARSIEDAVLADGALTGEFRRIGIRQGCAIHNRALGEASTRYKAEFDGILVAAMRKHVPATMLNARYAFPWGSAQMMAYEKRVVGEVETSGSAMFARARVAVLDAFLSAAAVQPAAPAEAASAPFADWDLERHGARKIACLVLRAPPEHVAARKLPFNGFFSKKGVQ